MGEEFIDNKRIEELHTVVKFVVELYDLENTLKKETKLDPDSAELDLINGYVGSDRSGTKEFAEYLALNYDRNEAAVTFINDEGELVSKKGDIQEINMRRIRLHSAVDEFCDFIRRRRIDKRLVDSAVSDVDKYGAMVELFGINYFKTNTHETSYTKQIEDRLRKERRVEVSRVRGATSEIAQRQAIRKDPKVVEKTLKFWEEKGELLPLRKKK